MQSAFRFRVIVVLLTLGIFLLPSIHARQGEKNPDPKQVKALIDKGIAYLRTVQNPDGSFAPKIGGPGVTALVVAGVLRSGVSEQDPMVEKALAYLRKSVKEDGGIYDKGLANYTTSVAIMAFKEANTNGKYDAILRNAAAFLKKVQHDEPESTSSDVKYGGFGYDASSRPDLSNSAFAIDALIAAGIPKDDPALQKALKFISRCQNLAGEANDQPFAQKATADDKGGFTYTPVDITKGEYANYRTRAGGLRSLGSMTYNGLKSFLYAGVDRNDPRVVAALDWIGRHYTLKENPGAGQAGLYYYYHTFAKAMDALGQHTFTDADKKKHNWRYDLFEELKSRQQKDGSWVNTGSRQFGESSPELATAFAILALEYCMDQKK